MKTIKKKSLGFFTLEALVAIFIFMVGVVGMLQIQINAISANSDAQYRINASYYAEQMIGEIYVNKAAIADFTGGSGEVYTSWLAEVTKSLPGVTNNPPTITAVQNGDTYFVTVTIFWKKAGDTTLSKYQTQTTIY